MHLDVCGVVFGQQCMTHNAYANNILFIIDVELYHIYVYIHNIYVYMVYI